MPRPIGFRSDRFERRGLLSRAMQVDLAVPHLASSSIEYTEILMLESISKYLVFMAYVFRRQVLLLEDPISHPGPKIERSPDSFS